jgi:hypothetical protein
MRDYYQELAEKIGMANIGPKYCDHATVSKIDRNDKENVNGYRHPVICMDCFKVLKCQHDRVETYNGIPTCLDCDATAFDC